MLRAPEPAMGSNLVAIAEFFDRDSKATSQAGVDRAARYALQTLGHWRWDRSLNLKHPITSALIAAILLIGLLTLSFRWPIFSAAADQVSQTFKSSVRPIGTKTDEATVELKPLTHKFSVTPPVIYKLSKYETSQATITVVEKSKVELQLELDSSMEKIELAVQNDQDQASQLQFYNAYQTIPTDRESHITKFNLDSLAKIESSSDQSLIDRIYKLFVSQGEGSQVQQSQPNFTIVVHPDQPPSVSMQSFAAGQSTEKLSSIRGTAEDDFSLQSVVLQIGTPENLYTAKPIELYNFENENKQAENRGLKLYQIQYSISSKSLAKFDFDYIDPAEIHTLNAVVTAIDNLDQATTSEVMEIELPSFEQLPQQSQLDFVIAKQEELKRQTDELARDGVLKRKDLQKLAQDQASLSPNRFSQGQLNELRQPEMIEKNKQASDAIQRGDLVSAQKLQQDLLQSMGNQKSKLEPLQNQNESNTQNTNSETPLAGKSNQPEVNKQKLLQTLKKLIEDQAVVSRQLGDADINSDTNSSKQTTDLQKSSLLSLDQIIDAIDSEKAEYWPLEQASQAMQVLLAKLERKSIDSADVQWSRNAENYLSAVADLMKSKQNKAAKSPENQPVTTTDNSTQEDSEKMRLMRQSVEIIRSLQRDLRDRLGQLAEAEFKDSSLYESRQNQIDVIHDSQIELSNKFNELLQQ